MKTTKAEMKQKENARITDIFANVGKGYGYDNVVATYSPLKDFKVRWQRTFKWAEFTVSDYLMGAPDNVLKGLADVLFRKISGQEVKGGYGKEMNEYVLSYDFRSKTRPTYLKRIRAQTVKDERLTAVIGKLVMNDVITDDEVEFRVKKLPYGKSTMYSSLFKVVVVNSRLLEDDVPDYVLETAIEYAYQEVMLGRKHFKTHKEYDAMDSVVCTRKSDAREWMDKHRLFIS